MKFILVLALTTFAWTTKYDVGDCITPTDTTYIWYGKYAKITGIYEVWGKVRYTLTFYKYDSSSNLFDIEIDKYTVSVNVIHCNNDIIQ